MNNNIETQIQIAAKEFAVKTIIAPEEHLDAVADFEERFTHGAEWLFNNIELLNSQDLDDALNVIDEVTDKYAMSLLKQCDISDFNEEDKQNLLDSFKYPFREGLDWAYDNY